MSEAHERQQEDAPKPPSGEQQSERLSGSASSNRRNAYALLGIAFLIVFGLALFLFNQAHAPADDAELGAAVIDSVPMTLTLSSPAFENNGRIPSQYTCDGTNTMPPLSFNDVPEGADSLVLVMDDPDIPQAVKDANDIEKFDHFVQYNLPADTVVVLDGHLPGDAGLNSRGDAQYTGPCPPTEYEPTEHRYIFRLYAITGTLSFDEPPTLDEVEAAAKERMIESAELIGVYDRTKSQD